MPDEKKPDLHDLKGVEIFKAGKWNGDTYTVEDLDEMVRSFQEVGGKMKPYLKLGHGDEQGLLRSDELPAAGWIDTVYRKGKTLFADFSRIPQKIYDLLSRGAYSRVSCEIYWNMEVAGRVYKRVLKAVALLGGETPAVHDLDDIMALYADGTLVKLGDVAWAYQATAEPKKAEVSQEALKNYKEDGPMEKEIEQLKADLAGAQKELAEANEQIAKFKADVEVIAVELAKANDSIKALTDERDAFKVEQEKALEEKLNSELEAKCEKYVQEKRISPAQKPFLFAILKSASSVEKKYKLGEEEVGVLSIVEKFLSENSAGLPTGTQTETGKSVTPDITELAKKYAEEHKVPFKDALIAVSRAPEEGAEA